MTQPLDDFREALAPYVTDSVTMGAALLALAGVLHNKGWHDRGGCPPCLAEHCPDASEHHGYAELIEAVQMLHQQAHNGSDEPLDARRCHREPCATVGGGPRV